MTLDGFGMCVTYGKDNNSGIGLPIVVDEDLASGCRIGSSQSLPCERQVCLKMLGIRLSTFWLTMANFCPDEWPYRTDIVNHAVYQRLHDASQGHPVFRKVCIDVPHWQVHVAGDAYEYLSNAPPVDVLYVDWFSWIDRFITREEHGFADMMAQYISKIRDGGLVIVDHKHKQLREGGCRWFNHPSETFSVGPHSVIERYVWLNGWAKIPIMRCKHMPLLSTKSIILPTANLVKPIGLKSNRGFGRIQFLKWV